MSVTLITLKHFKNLRSMERNLQQQDFLPFVNVDNVRIEETVNITKNTSFTPTYPIYSRLNVDTCDHSQTFLCPKEPIH